MTVVVSVVGVLAEHVVAHVPLSFALFWKWFFFLAVGLRLAVAGVQQIANPAFIALEIFHIENSESFPVVRELGFANLCFGLVGIVSLAKPEWRPVSAFASGMYYGLAGLMHVLKKPAGVNERFALWTDWVIFGVLVGYFT